MRNLFIAIFCAVVVILHISAAGVFFKAERVPNITLAFVISLVFILGLERSLVWIVLAGLLLDAVSGHIFGTSALLLVLMGWIISALSTAVDFKSRRMLFLPVLFFLSASLAFLFDILDRIFIRVSGVWFNSLGIVASINYFSWDYFLKIVFTALFVFVIYYLTKRLNKFLLIWR